ncbi:HsdM family class I SAM-dependent methyltransferase [Coleofasciculus sp. G2-EDA-02]|uniref:HsdM family class I SAM-dependent methyltransferase n=1 Tax=Coleofasciculus sp. G2-EDA-02 TaxID=3069529 RepID=UPI0040632087
MSSQTAVTTSYLQVMEATGFYRNGIPTSGVIPAASLRSNPQQLDKRIKYSAVINPEQLNATAIFELCGSPCIYFTQLRESDPEPQELARLHQLSWNHGLAPMLWIVTPTKVLLYNCYSQPTENDRNNPERHLIEIFQQTETGLKQLNQYASRIQIESGEFWQWEKAKQIDRKQRVDAVLVKDLTDTEEILVVNKGLKRSVAQSFLIQSIFVAYLQDREILNSQLLQRQFGFNSFTEILDSKSGTDHLFSWIQIIFNGDLFGLSREEINRVQLKHLEVIKNFIGGLQEAKTGQLRLWRAYNFKVIPVELISAIYEKFIYAEDAKSAKAHSTHYTPINLVDLVLSEVFKELDGSAKVLDLACGSGVFLVDALRRLVVKRLASGEHNYRQIVRDTLYHQIYGVDIKQKAIQIAAFSLYLTALELDYELERNPDISEDLQFEKIIGKNLFVGDAFDEEAEFNRIEPFAHKQFSAIVGNPPWTKSKYNKSAIDYCKRERSDYPKGYPITRSDNPDQAFLWRIGDFANEETWIGLIVHGKPFFSATEKAQYAKKVIFSRFNLKIVINLSKLRNYNLFPKSKAPTMVLIAQNKSPDISSRDNFYFVCPDCSPDYKRHGILEIGAEDIKRLSISRVIFEPDMLKVASWGSPRDMALIVKLKSYYQSLRNVIDTYQWFAGQGFQDVSGQGAAPELYGKKKLPSGKIKPYQVNLDILEDIPIGKKFHRPRDSRIYKGPLVITTGGLSKKGFFSAFSQEDIVYTEKYTGISIPQSQVKLAHYLNAILNSQIASYFLFLTSSTWGIERDEIKPVDLYHLPIALASNENEEIMRRILEIEIKLRDSKQNTTQEKKEALNKQLNQTVFELYKLDKQEQILIEDKFNFTIDWFMKRKKSKAIQYPKIEEIELYVEQLIGVIQPFLQTLNERKIVAEVIDVGKAPLQVVKFSIVPVSSQLPIVQTISGHKLEAVLKRIAEQLPQQIADRIYTRRDLRIYVGKDIYIVKPAKRIYWTRSAGLNDADTILSEYLRTSHASIG